MSEVNSTLIKIKSPIMPPKVDFIEKKLLEMNFPPVRWAIVDIVDNELTLSVSYLKS